MTAQFADGIHFQTSQWPFSLILLQELRSKIPRHCPTRTVSHLGLMKNIVSMKLLSWVAFRTCCSPPVDSFLTLWVSTIIFSRVSFHIWHPRRSLPTSQSHIHTFFCYVRRQTAFHSELFFIVQSQPYFCTTKTEIHWVSCVLAGMIYTKKLSIHKQKPYLGRKDKIFRNNCGIFKAGCTRKAKSHSYTFSITNSGISEKIS